MKGPDEIAPATEPRPAAVSGSGSAIRVCLVEDHHLVREGLRLVLSTRGIDVVGESPTAAGAFDLVARHHPDVLLLDLSLAEEDGITVLRELRARQPDTRVVVLTMHRDPETVRQALLAGAAGYILKQVRGQDLLDAVRRVAAGQSLLDPAVTQQVLDRLREGPKQDSALAGLTEQERKVLELIGEGLTNRAIGERMFLAEKTVKNYVSSLLAKLGLERRTQAAVFASKHPRGSDG